jgi:hypothetical protein
MSSRATQSRSRQVLLRWLAVITLSLAVLGSLGAAGYHFFTGWRARDLAAKAKDNFEKAQLPHGLVADQLGQGIAGQ